MVNNPAGLTVVECSSGRGGGRVNPIEQSRGYTLIFGFTIKFESDIQTSIR